MAFRDFLKVQKQGLQGMTSVGVIGLHMVSGPLVGVVIGYFLDKWLGTGPWLKLVFLVVGIGAGFLNVYVDTSRLVKRLDRDAHVTDSGPSQVRAQGPQPSAGPSTVKPNTSPDRDLGPLPETDLIPPTEETAGPDTEKDAPGADGTARSDADR